MKKIIFNNTDCESPDGSQIASICEKHDIPFSCNSGV